MKKNFRIQYYIKSINNFITIELIKKKRKENFVSLKKII